MGAGTSTHESGIGEYRKVGEDRVENGGHDSVALPSFGSAFLQPNRDEKPEITDGELETLIASANVCMMDPNALRRKHALQQVLALLVHRSLGNVNARRDVTEAVCLALSLNVVSTDDDTQYGALKGVLFMCGTPVFIPPLLEKGVADSICTLLRRETTNQIALDLCVRILRQVCTHCPDVVHQLLRPFHDAIDKILEAGQKMGGNSVNEVLLTFSTFPIQKVARYDAIWILLVKHLTDAERIHDSRYAIFLARLANERGQDSLRIIANSKTLLEILKGVANRACQICIADCAKLDCGRNKFLVNLVCSQVNQTLSSGEASDKAKEDILFTVIDLCLIDDAFGESFIYSEISSLLTKLQSDFRSLASCAALSIVVSGASTNLSSKAQTEWKHALLALGPLDLAQLGTKLLDCLETPTKGRIDSLLLKQLLKSSKVDPPHPIARRASLETVFDQVTQAAIVCLLVHSIEANGWIETGLFGGTESLDRVLDREESEDQLEQQFVWSWRHEVVDCLLEISQPSSTITFTPYASRLAARCLVALCFVEGPDRRDRLVLDAKWEASDRPLPVNQARVDLFLMENNFVPQILSAPKELRSGIFVDAQESIVFRRLRREQRDFPGDYWTLAIWVKQLKPVIIDERPPCTRVIAGCVSNSSYVLALTDDLQLACKSIDGDWTRFGSWEQLASGWHHVVIICGENKNLAGIDLVMGRSCVLTCFVDGHRLGMPVICTKGQCPNPIAGLVIGCNTGPTLFPLGQEFALSEVRMFDSSVSERTVSSSVARSSFNRRPNWNMSVSTGASRFTPAHIWARSRLLDSSLAQKVIKDVVRSSDSRKVTFGRRLVRFLLTVGSEKRVAEAFELDLENLHLEACFEEMGEEPASDTDRDTAENPNGRDTEDVMRY